MLVLVDGLNLHHALRKQDPENLNLNLIKLCETIASNNSCGSVEIMYFTALVEHLDKRARDFQVTYINSLEEKGVQVFRSEFRSHLDICDICGNRTRKYVEKQTDVAIASHLISNVLENNFEDVLLFSADSDFLPALKMIKDKKPLVGLRVVSTLSYLRPIYGPLRKEGIGTIRLSPELVTKHQFQT